MEITASYVHHNFLKLIGLVILHIATKYIAPGLSDHDAVILDMYHHVGHNVKPKKKIYCFKKADWASLQIELENITNTYFQLNEANSRSIQDNWDYFHNFVLQAIDTHIPVKSISNVKSPPWMTSQLKRLIRKKQRLYNKAKASKTTLNWTANKNIQRQVRQSMRVQHDDYLANLLNSSSRLKLMVINLFGVTSSLLGKNTLELVPLKPPKELSHLPQVRPKHLINQFSQ